ncbi:MAG: Cytosolic protein [Mitsuokella multacida]|jgi:hypothetical protein
MDRMDWQDEWLQGAIDMHVHAAPDIMQRKYTDAKLVQQYRALGMGGFVSKCHHGDTSSRSAILSELFPQKEGRAVYGGVVLNHSVGGLNPDAVTSCGKMGGRIVWFPTVDAENDAFYKKQHKNPALGQANEQPTAKPKIHILDERGKLLQEASLVLEAIRAEDMILATGHLSPKESLVLVREAAAMGIEKIIVTHVTLPLTYMDLSLQKSFLDCGAMLEHCFYTPYHELVSWQEIAESIHQAGAEHIILSTDLGQKSGMDPAAGLQEFAKELYGHGIDGMSLQQIMVKNPRGLLS